MWKCHNCGMTNSTDVCCVCGVRRDFLAQTEPVNNNSVVKKKKSGTSMVIIVVLLVTILVVAGFVGFSIYNKKNRIEFDRGLSHAEQLLNCKSYVDCLAKLDKLKNNRLYYKSTDALYLEGMAYMGMEDYANAIDCFEKSLECGSSDEVQVDLAVCYAKNGNESKALRELYKINPGKDFVKCIEAEILLQKGNYEKAADGFREVIAMTTDNDLKRRSYIELARVYKAMDTEDGDYTDMQISVLEEAIRVLNAGDDLVLTEMIAQAYFEAKQYEQSADSFRRLLTLGYDKPYIYRNIAIIYQQMENLSEAKNILLEMQKKYPTDSTCYAQLAFVYMDMESQKPRKQRNYNKVKAYYELALKYNTQDTQSIVSQLEESIVKLRQKGWIN